MTMRGASGDLGTGSGGTLYFSELPSFGGGVRVFWRYRDRRRCSVAGIVLPGTEHGSHRPPAMHNAHRFEGTLPRPLASLVSGIAHRLAGEAAPCSHDLLELEGCTPFQRRVLLETARIPRGKTLSYGRLAERVGVPGAARAVGTVMARNPFPIVFPCHRVVRSSGKPGRFAAVPGMKEALLCLEGVIFEDSGVVSASCRW